ncbi:MAG TPA: DNA replication/repair protein RecF [Firmicutes bacterium]|nr:DNA replication/repair protein RecF [Bacillota bacterium]
MHVEALELNQFRNYRNLNIELDPYLNIFVGDNAQGKTNLLESVYFLATGRSHRTNRDWDLIYWHGEEAQVKAQVTTAIGSFTMRAVLSRDRRKRFMIGGEELRRQSDLLGFLNVVLFSPDDLQLIKGSPTMRRRFIDLLLAQISKVYRHDLVNYNRVLQQRNTFLKSIAEGKGKREDLLLWDEQLIHYGTQIMVRRAKAVERLGELAGINHRRISGGEENLTVHYLPFYAAEGSSDNEFGTLNSHDFDAVRIGEDFAQGLEANRQQEMRRGVTLVGPQRDDILFRIDGKDARQFASQGQQRTVVLAVKLAELEFMREEVGEYPVFLLDDVLSELDFSRRSSFLEIIGGKVQTLLTTTDVGNFRQDKLDHYREYGIVDGRLVGEG